MRTTHKISFVFVALSLAVSTFAQERKVKPSELPPSVEKTVEEQSKGATIRGFTVETENGQTTHEVEMVVNSHCIDVRMDANGVVIETEEQVDLQAVSAEVRAGLQAKAGKGKLMKVESITKKGKLVAYVGLGPTQVWGSYSDKFVVGTLGYIAKRLNAPVSIVDVDQVGRTDSEQFAVRKIPRITIHSLTQKLWEERIIYSSKDKFSAMRLDDYSQTYGLLAAYLAFLDQIVRGPTELSENRFSPDGMPPSQPAPKS